jgi:hypothetical protein
MDPRRRPDVDSWPGGTQIPGLARVSAQCNSLEAIPIYLVTLFTAQIELKQASQARLQPI